MNEHACGHRLERTQKALDHVNRLQTDALGVFLPRLQTPISEERHPGWHVRGLRACPAHRLCPRASAGRHQPRARNHSHWQRRKRHHTFESALRGMVDGRTLLCPSEHPVRIQYARPRVDPGVHARAGRHGGRAPAQARPQDRDPVRRQRLPAFLPLCRAPKFTCRAQVKLCRPCRMPRLEGECAATPSRQARGASLVGCAVQRISQPFHWLHAVRALESNAIAREHPRAAPRTLAQSQSRGIDDMLAHHAQRLFPDLPALLRTQGAPRRAAPPAPDPLAALACTACG